MCLILEPLELNYRFPKKMISYPSGRWRLHVDSSRSTKNGAATKGGGRSDIPN